MKKEIIFVAEDDTGLLSLILKNLNRMNYEVEGFSEGSQLIERLNEKIPSLMLLDYQLIDMTAKELIEKLILENTLSPFIIMTGHGNETLAVEMMKLGANDYLVKDSSFLGLLPTVVKQSLKHSAVEKKLTQTQMEKEKLEVQLRQALKMEAIGTLAGGIAHDFNNILFPLIGFTEMLQEDLPEDSPLKEYVKEILSASMRAKDLVKQILTFSRQVDYELNPIRLHIFLKEIIKLNQAILPSNIRITKEINSECGSILADPTQIHQLIMNLITNAYHAMQEKGGQLLVALREVIFTPDNLPSTELELGKHICLIVEDSGIGIDKTIVDKIFDPYFTTKDIDKGTGLGLSVVHGIVKKYKGDILVNSTLGKGTRFEVYFPVYNEKKESAPKKIKDKLPKGNGRILLVDDEENIF